MIFIYFIFHKNKQKKASHKESRTYDDTFMKVFHIVIHKLDVYITHSQMGFV
jgi:hypothetical protein